MTTRPKDRSSNDKGRREGGPPVRGKSSVLVPKPHRLLRQRLDERVAQHARAQTDRHIALQRKHDADFIGRRVAATWPTAGPRWVSVNEMQPVRVESRDALVDLMVAMAQRVPSHLTAVIDEVDVVTVAGRDLYFAHRLARVLPAAREAIAAEDPVALASLCAFVESMLALPCSTTRHRIFLADAVAEVECRSRAPLLHFVLAILWAVRAYLAALPPPSPSSSLCSPSSSSSLYSPSTLPPLACLPLPQDALTGAAVATPAACTPCPAPAGMAWPRVFAESLLRGDVHAVAMGGITYQRQAGVWLRCTPHPVALQPATAADRLAQDYCMWGGPLVVGMSPVRDPVVDWAESLYLCVCIDGVRLWTIERALADALSRCPADYYMHGVFRAMLDCVRTVEASPRIHHHVIAPLVLANMVA